MLTVNRKELLSRLEPAARVAPTRTPKEILRWVRLTHDGTTLTIVAWDGEVGIRLTLACEGQACDFLLPAAHSVAVLKSFTSETIKIDPQESRTHVTGNREKFSLPTHPLTDWPTWEHKGEAFTIPAGFGTAIQRVRCAVAESHSKFALTGVLLELAGFVVACNGNVLCSESVSVAASDTVGILPAKMADAASRLAGDIQASVSPNGIELTDGDVVVFGRLVQGMFPNWRDIIGGVKPDAELDISVGELLRVTRQAMLATDVERMSIDIAIKDGTLSASSGSTNRGDSSVELPIASDADVTVTFDGTFLAGMLAGLDPLEIVHWCVSTNGPNKFTLRNWTGIIMPMAEG